MSSYHEPSIPLAFSADILYTSVMIGTSTTASIASMVTSFLTEGLFIASEVGMVLAKEASKLTILSAKGLNEVQKEGVKVGRDLGKETLGFLSGGAAMSASMASDLTQGAKGELIHGVKEGGRLFSARIAGAEVIFERCGTAIVGKFADADQAEIDKATSQRIADAYQMILQQVGEISVGKDPIMLAHKKSMEATNQSIIALKAESQAIHRQVELMEKERSEAQEALQQIDDSMEKASNNVANEAKAAFKQSVKELNQKISTKEKARVELKTRSEEQRRVEMEQEETLERLELRMEQSNQLVDVHRSRVREHTTQEIQRIMSGHGLDNPTIELSEGENNQIRIHIEE